MTAANHRTADHEIDPLFLDRWSPRAFTEDEIPEATLFSILEAARWAPSSHNSQPWRFVYARRGSEHWDGLLSLLNAFNSSWAKAAGALVVIVSKPTLAVPGKDEEIPRTAIPSTQEPHGRIWPCRRRGSAIRRTGWSGLISRARR